MKVLLCGASGFVGRHIRQALIKSGHLVEAAVCNYTNDTKSEHWLPRLNGIDAVINAVGILRDSKKRPIYATHQNAPSALFDACFEKGIERILHISALGVDYNQTDYAKSKLAADQHLIHLIENQNQNQNKNINNHIHKPCFASILRPSIVFGRGGASSSLFMNLARLPILPLPKAVLMAKVQPISVHDLADFISALLIQKHNGIIECTGSEALTMSDFIASLRQQNGHQTARVLVVPDWLSKSSARLGDYLPAFVPWCSETLSMLGQDNIAKNNQDHLIENILGRKTVHYSDFVNQN